VFCLGQVPRPLLASVRERQAEERMRRRGRQAEEEAGGGGRRRREEEEQEEEEGGYAEGRGGKEDDRSFALRLRASSSLLLDKRAGRLWPRKL